MKRMKTMETSTWIIRSRGERGVSVTSRVATRARAKKRERANYWAAHNCRKLRNLSRRTLEANVAAGRSLIGPLDCHLPGCVANR